MSTVRITWDKEFRKTNQPLHYYYHPITTPNTVTAILIQSDFCFYVPCKIFTQVQVHLVYMEKFKIMHIDYKK